MRVAREVTRVRLSRARMNIPPSLAIDSGDQWYYFGCHEVGHNCGCHLYSINCSKAAARTEPTISWPVQHASPAGYDDHLCPNACQRQRNWPHESFGPSSGSDRPFIPLLKREGESRRAWNSGHGVSVNWLSGLRWG